MSRWFVPNPASVAPGVLAAQVTPPGAGTMLQPSVVSQRMKEFFFTGSHMPVFFNCLREGLLQMSVEWFSDRKIMMMVNGPMSQEWCDIADDCGKQVTVFDTAYGAETDMDALTVELQKEKFDVLMFVETDVFMGTSLNADAICGLFREKCPDGLIVIDVSGCVFCGFDEKLSELADICLCGSEMALGLPPGLGMVIPNERAHTRLLAHNIMNGHYFNYPRQTVSRGASSFEAPSYQLLNALNEQIDTVLTEGIPDRVSRMAAVRNYIYEWIASRSIPVLSAAPVCAVNCTAILLPPGIAPQEIADHCLRYGIFLAPGVGQMPKESLMIYHGNDITPDDVRALIRVLNRFFSDYDTRRRNNPLLQPQEQKV